MPLERMANHERVDLWEASDKENDGGHCSDGDDSETEV